MPGFDRHRSPTSADRSATPDLDRTRSWRDPRALVAALGPAGRIAAIDPTPDAVLAAATLGEVVAVGGEGPIAVVDLALAAGRLHHVEARQLYGLAERGRRVFLYHRVREALRPSSRRFWDAREDAIREGLTTSGRLETAVLAASRLARATRSPGLARHWLDLGGPEERERFHDERWDGLRWRLALQRVTPALGPRATVRAVRDRVRRALVDSGVAGSGDLQWLVLGGWQGDAGLPLHLTADGHRRIAELAPRVTLVIGDPDDALGAERGAWDAIDLATEPARRDDEGVARLLEAAIRGARPGARVVRWTGFDDRPWPPPGVPLDRIGGEAALVAAERGWASGEPRAAVVRGALSRSVISVESGRLTP